MNLDKELLNLKDNNSLVRLLFQKQIDLAEPSLEEFEIPQKFKDESFIPKSGFDLSKICDNITEKIRKVCVSEDYISKTIPGLCEAIKNAYEHGNLKDNCKKITIARNFTKDELEFFVGDEGGKIDGNFFPYILLFRTNSSYGSNEDIPDFYKFSGKNYAPLGHSGVGTKTMNKCFDKVCYFKNKNNGLLVYLKKGIR